MAKARLTKKKAGSKVIGKARLIKQSEAIRRRLKKIRNPKKTKGSRFV